MRIKIGIAGVLLGAALQVSCQAAKDVKQVGGPFENESFGEEGKPAIIGQADTSAGWYKFPGNRLIISGTVLKPDGTTPAQGVTVYYYHTNPDGKYLHNASVSRSMKPNAQGQTHGYLRGWVKTAEDGRYQIFTSRPGAYPGRTDPQHIHLTVDEPGYSPYYIDDIVFDDDVLLTSKRRLALENRSGSGIVRLVNSNGVPLGKRDIILGMNIPEHPGRNEMHRSSGNPVGSPLHSFTPKHVWGADSGSVACPVCKYGWYQGIIYFVDSTQTETDLVKWMDQFEVLSKKMQPYLKVYIVIGSSRFQNTATHAWLENIGKKKSYEKLALTWLPSFADTASDVYLNNIRHGVSTMLVFRRSNIVGSYIDIKPGKSSFDKVEEVLQRGIDAAFYLPALVEH